MGAGSWAWLMINVTEKGHLAWLYSVAVNIAQGCSPVASPACAKVLGSLRGNSNTITVARPSRSPPQSYPVTPSLAASLLSQVDFRIVRCWEWNPDVHTCLIHTPGLSCAPTQFRGSLHGTLSWYRRFHPITPAVVTHASQPGTGGGGRKIRSSGLSSAKQRIPG